MILIDPPAWPAHGRLFCHLVSDESVAELHELAAAAGVRPRAFDGDHYDVPEELYGACVAAGASAVSAHDLVRRLNASGLRWRRRRGDKLLDVVVDGLVGFGVSHRVEVVRSRQGPPAASTVGAVAFVTDGPRVLLLEHPRRRVWEAPGGGVEAGETPAEAAAREVSEETGVSLDAARLVPRGYERLTWDGVAPDPRAAAWPSPAHVAVFAGEADLRGVAGPGALGPEGARLAVVDPAEARRRCGGSAWWPLLAEHVGLPLPSPSWATGRAGF